jgi:hypothetical protein
MEDSGSPAKSTGATSAAVISKHGLPRSSEVLRLIEKNLADSSPPAVVLTLRVKFELLVTYGIAQGGATADSKDPEWLNIVHDGRLGAALDAAFAQPDGSGRVYRETLKSIITAW